MRGEDFVRSLSLSLSMATKMSRRPWKCIVTVATASTIVVTLFLLVVEDPWSPNSETERSRTRSYLYPVIESREKSDTSASSEHELSAKPVWNLERTLVDRFVEWPSVCGRAGQQRLLVLVTSAPQNFDRRRAIRETWGSAEPTRSGVVFLVGRPSTDALVRLLENEMSAHDDLLLGDYVDTYRNLTLKVLHGFLFTERACGTSSGLYILKTDDDCFVNVRLLVDFLEMDSSDSSGSRCCDRGRRLYVGRLQRRSKVIRSPHSRWYVSRELYRPDVYPEYASGIGYIISADLLPSLLAAASRLSPFPNEDAYVGSLVSAVGVVPVHSARFVLHGHRLIRTCNYLYVMVVHRVVGISQQGKLNGLAAQAMAECPRHPFLDDRWNVSSALAKDDQLSDDLLVLTSWR